MRFYVKWGFTDDYGRAYEKNAYFDWFETKEQAEEFVAKKRKGNGGYFHLWKFAEGTMTSSCEWLSWKRNLQS